MYEMIFDIKLGFMVLTLAYWFARNDYGVKADICAIIAYVMAFFDAEITRSFIDGLMGW